MKEKTFRILSAFVDWTTVLITIVCGFMNFENVTYYTCSIHPVPKMSLYVRYHYWLKKIYGEEKGKQVYRKMRDFTIKMINNGTNHRLLIVLSMMVLASIIISWIVNKRLNRRFIAYYSFCLIVLCFATFIAGPFYIDGIYDK